MIMSDNPNAKARSNSRPSRLFKAYLSRIQGLFRLYSRPFKPYSKAMVTKACSGQAPESIRGRWVAQAAREGFWSVALAGTYCGLVVPPTFFDPQFWWRAPRAASRAAIWPIWLPELRKNVQIGLPEGLPRGLPERLPEMRRLAAT